MESLVTLAQWQALEAKIVSDMTAGVKIANYSIAGRSFGYSSLREQREMLEYVRQQIANLSTGGMFYLARSTNA